MVCVSRVHIPFLGIDILVSIHNRLMADVPERRQRRTEGSEGTSTNGLAESQRGLQVVEYLEGRVGYQEV